MRYQPPFVYGQPPAASGIHNADADAPYVNGDPTFGREGSFIPCEAIEHPQRELIKLLVSCGIVPSVTQLDQIAEAVARYASLGIAGALALGSTGSAHVVDKINGAVMVPRAYFDGLIIIYTPGVGNAGAVTCNAFGLGVKSVVKYNGAALAGGEFVAARQTMLRYSAALDKFLLLPWADATIGDGGGGGGGGVGTSPTTGVLIGLRGFQTSDTYTKTPSATRALVIATGGGGGGGGCYGDTTAAGGGAGGTGINMIDLTGITSIPIVIGSAGAGGTANGGKGGDGGSTSVGTYVVATGGKGGVGADQFDSPGGDGGTVTAGIPLPGNPGDGAGRYNGGTGGASFWGGAGRCGSYTFSSGTTHAAGFNATGYGSGGGGADGLPTPGGAGKSGYALLLEFA